MNMKTWTKVLTFAFAMSIAVNLAAADEGRSEEQEKKPTPATQIDSPKEPQASEQSSGEDYVVVMTDKDTTPLNVYQKYLESADFWRQLTEHNLLKDGVTVKIPKDMLKTGQIPAKVTKFSGSVEIARNFDWRWVKVVPNMLVQEGDWIRTRAKSSAEVQQDDGTVIGCGGVRRVESAPASDDLRFEVKHLWLTPAARGRGAGRRLLAELERRAIEFGADELVLDTNASLAAAGGLYRSSGYAEIEPYNANPNATHWYGKQVDR